MRGVSKERTVRGQQPERGWAVQRRGEGEVRNGGVALGVGRSRSVVGRVAAAWLGAVALAVAFFIAIPTLERVANISLPGVGPISSKTLELFAESRGILAGLLKH